MLLHDEPHEFKSSNGTPSRCRVRVFAQPGETRATRYIVIFTDDQSAAGTSITNGAEIIAQGVRRKYRLPIRQTTWVEHYDFRSLPGGRDRLRRTETFDRVTFEAPEKGQAASDYIHDLIVGEPRWQPSTKPAVELLIGSPLP